MIKTSLFRHFHSGGRHVKLVVLGALAAISAAQAATSAITPQVGESAPNFSLQTLDARTVELKQLVAEGPVVLVVLRGWPGYQCPLCTRQVHDFVANAAEFGKRNASVVMVYPGPMDQLQARAQEFLQDKNWPSGFVYLLDPDYRFTHAYGLRWEAKKETAYPSTFVIERGGKIRFAQVSHSHGNRLSAARALAELK